MRVCSIEVTDFRRVTSCRVELGPGLNVLYGPNELGKSTLAEALRAALLVPSGASAVGGFRPWGSDAVPEVALLFEHGGETWRLRKRFALGTRGSALLQRATESGAFVEEARGRAVDGKIREMLRWGLPAPGGKGGTKSATFLTTALLAPQGETQGILEKKLEDDADPSGRALITDALDALDQHPWVRELLDRLDEKVGTAYTDRGRQRRTADSPLVASAQRVIAQQEVLARLERDLAESRGVEAQVRRLREERDQALAAREDAERHLDALEEARRRAAAREKAHAELLRLEAELERIDAHAREVALEAGRLRDLEERLGAAEASAAAERARHDRAASGHAEALQRLQSARAAGETAAAVAANARRIELTHERASAERLAEEARLASAALDGARALAQEVAATEAAARAAALALRRASLRRACADASARLDEARARREAHARAAHELEGALAAQAQARAALREAEERLAEAEAALDRVQGAVHRAAEQEAARTRLVDLELEARRCRERLERHRAVEAKRAALAEASAERAELERRLAALRAALDENGRRAEAARAQETSLGELQRVRALARARERLAALAARRTRGQALRETQARLRREGEARVREAEARRPATSAEIERLRWLAGEVARVREGGPREARVPVGAALAIAAAAAGLGVALTGVALGFGAPAFAAGAGAGAAAFGFAAFALRRHARARARRAWETAVREAEARRDAETGPRLRASGVADVEALEALSLDAVRLREEARAAAAEADEIEGEIRDLFVASEQIEDAERAVRALEQELAPASLEVLERRSREAGDDGAIARGIQEARRALESLERERAGPRDELAEVQALHRALGHQVETGEREIGAMTDGTSAGDVTALGESLERLEREREELRARAGVTEADGAGAASEQGALRAARDEARAARDSAAERLGVASERVVEARTRAEEVARGTAGLDPEALAGELDAARAALAASGDDPEADPGADPGAVLERARAAAEEAQRALDARRVLARAEEERAAVLVEKLGWAPEEALAEVAARREAIQAELDGLEAERHGAEIAGTDAEETAVAAAAEALEGARAGLEAALRARDAVRAERDVVVGRLEALRRNAPACTVAGGSVEAARDALQALAGADPVSDEALSEAAAERDERAQALAEADRRLHEIQGQLQLLGGAVLAERCREAAMQLERLQQAHRELELHFDAYRLLADTVRRLDAQRSGDLGRALARPVAERFLALAGGPYTGLCIDPSLRTAGVEAAGGVRKLHALSIGTRDQLATLLRLAIAEHLRTALLLDDQLTQSDPARMRWLRDTLRGAAERGTQILVLTCRPDDYLEPGEAPAPGEVMRQTAAVTAVDLSCAVSRGGLEGAVAGDRQIRA